MNINKAQLLYINSGELDKLGTWNDLVSGDALLNVAQFLVDKLRDSATAKGVVASKELRSGIDTSNLIKSGSNVEIAIVMPPQWRFAEYGRKPTKHGHISGTPFLWQSIEQWITAKGIPVRKNKGESKLTVLERRHGMAVAIANKIHKSGTIKRFGYQGSGFIATVMTPANQKVIAEHFAALVGKKIGLIFSVKE